MSETPNSETGGERREDSSHRCAHGSREEGTILTVVHTLGEQEHSSQQYPSPYGTPWYTRMYTTVTHPGIPACTPVLHTLWYTLVGRHTTLRYTW